MKNRLNQLYQWLDERELRERVLVLLLLLVMAFILWSTLLQDPLSKQHKSLTENIQTLTKQTQLLEEQSQLIISEATKGPNQKLVAKEQVLTKKMRSLDKQLASYHGKLLSPRALTLILKQVLAKSGNLNLIKVSSEPQIRDEKEKSAVMPGSLVEYQVSMVFSGDYFAVSRYLQQLEKAPYPLFWDKIDYKVSKYPLAEVTLTMHTLTGATK